MDLEPTEAGYIYIYIIYNNIIMSEKTIYDVDRAKFEGFTTKPKKSKVSHKKS